MTARKSCRYIFPIVSGGRLGLGIVLKSFMLCQQQSTSNLGFRSDNSMGLRGLFDMIDPFEHVSTLTISTTSLECRSVKRNMELTVGRTLCLNLDWIASQTTTRLRQVSILFPVMPWSESILQHAAELMFMLTPDDIRGRLVETPHGHGVASDFVLEFVIALVFRTFISP